MRDNARTVYSTGAGRMCPGCGWPADNCQCSSQHAKDEPLPARIVAKLRIEKTGRGGKTVTVIYDLPRNAAFIKELTLELKRTCGVGGTAQDDRVELQGEQRDRVRDLLRKKGFVVKG
jgi:translation initiation factor 1